MMAVQHKETMMDCKYLICENWGHIFEEEGRDRERDVRFVYDTGSETVVNMDVKRGNKWHAASKIEMADLEDSLKNANEEALENPEEWGIDREDDLPDWAEAPGSIEPS